MSLKPPPDVLRAAARNIGGIGLVLLALAVSVAATFVRDSKHLVPGMATARDVPGTCHNDQDIFEVELTTAELTPPVSCTRPHTGEVVWTVQLTGVVAKEHDRPTPEMLKGQYGSLCDYGRLKKYVGKTPEGYLYNLSLSIRYPSAPEWREGLRTARCIAQPNYRQGPIRAVLDFPLRDSWRTKASAVIRLCAVGRTAYLTCDQPHTEEVLEPVNPFPKSQKAFPPEERSIRLGRKPCTRQALALLGRSKVPDGLSVIVEPAEIQNWNQHHDVGCRIGSPLRSGSLAAGLR
jgi:Septum formation